MKTSIVIESRFQGPPDSGNGGYTCGLLGNYINGVSQVRLRRPPPIDAPLMVERLPDDKVILLDKGTVIAEAMPAELVLTPPDPPALEDVEACAVNANDLRGEHYFPECFVCGPNRAQGDGLRIFPAPVEGRGYIAATWHADSSLSDESGLIRKEVMWAAMDCPSGWAIIYDNFRFLMLGGMTAHIEIQIRPGEKYIVLAWPMEQEGRKLYAGSAIYTREGRLCAKAKAVWIEMK